MFSREIIVLLLLIKIIFVFFFYYSTISSYLYRLFIKFFTFDSFATLILFITYFESVIFLEKPIFIFNFFFFLILCLQLINNKLILYIYGINLNYSKKKYGIVFFLFLFIKFLIYLQIEHRYFVKNYFLIIFSFLLLLYYFFFVIKIKNLIIINNNYGIRSRISFLYSILFYFHIFNNYVVVPCFILYELVFVINNNFFIYYEKIMLIRDIIVLLFIMHIFYYILMYFMWFTLNKNSFIQSNEKYDIELYLSISDIKKIYSYKNSLVDISLSFLIKNINIIIDLCDSYVKVYDFDEENIDILFLGDTLDDNQVNYYSYTELLQISLFRNLYSFYKIKNIENILLIMKKYNINIFYKCFLLGVKKQYLIFYNKNNDIFKKSFDINIIMKVDQLVKYLNNFIQELLDYFYYENIFYNQYIVRRSMKENKENFDSYYNYIVNNMNDIKYATIFYSLNINSNSNNKILNHNNISGELLEYLDDTVISLKSKSGLVEYQSNFVLQKNYICELVVKRKKEVYYACFFFPILLVDAEYAYNFAFYNILISLFGNNNILQKGDLDFFFHLVSGFQCKVFFTEHMDSFIFFPFIDYLLKKIDYCVYYFNFELDDVDTFFESYCESLLTKKVVIISYGLNNNNLKKQDLFYKKYSEFIMKEETQLKWYIFSNHNSLDIFSSVIIGIAEIIFYKNFFYSIEEVYIKSIIETFLNIIGKKICKNSEKKYFEYVIDNKFDKSNLNMYSVFHNYYEIYQSYEEEKYLLETNHYLKEAKLLKRKSLENKVLMEKLLLICNENYAKLANIIGVHRSTISRYFKKK